MSINARILTGFIFLIVVYSIAGYIGLNNLDKSKELTSQNSMVIQPSIILLSDLQINVTKAKNFTYSWYIQDITDDPDKAALKALHNEVFPPLMKRCEERAATWTDSSYIEMHDGIIKSLRGALMEQKQIMQKLNSIDAYNDFNVRVLEVEQGHLDQSNFLCDEVNSMLEILIDKLKADAAKEEKEVQLSYRKIRITNIIITAVSLIISIVVALVILRSVRLQRQKDIVTEERDMIQEQKLIIEEKNADILSSITYAKRIQNSILPPDDQIGEHFSESFILYEPRDIVSGDFYWHRKLNESGTKFLVAAADATGHGVPGAFVSLVCYNSLNRALDENGLEYPARILNKARDYVVKAFEEHGSAHVRDGMDISLCYFDLEQKIMKFSGAHNGAVLIRNGELKLIEADRMPVGSYERQEAFTEHEVELQDGDSIYIYSDGLSDQFGGPRERKFKAVKLKELLLSIQDKDMPSQGAHVSKTIRDWQGDVEQLDDWLMIGMKV